ncbi:hypothetical protein OGAPHI_006570 [Ogataea philodendri]|uniref:Uncharacterized protein n=1 Tax=Ogataea philodendri TaxID=1378263 RepID=A0A9P8NVP3_9ASCO|nr:uncharacterized protein OGAPHI_006570 [Ogataea philodendri]KAH3661163.1 hypothetical protein OGAPHI_006570 [Ogataea philodendri]
MVRGDTVLSSFWKKCIGGKIPALPIQTRWTSAYSTVTTILNKRDELCFVFGKLAGMGFSHNHLDPDKIEVVEEFFDEHRITLDQSQMNTVHALLEYRKDLKEITGLNFIMGEFKTWIESSQKNEDNTLMSYSRTFLKVLKFFTAVSNLLGKEEGSFDYFDIADQLYVYRDHDDPTVAYSQKDSKVLFWTINWKHQDIRQFPYKFKSLELSKIETLFELYKRTDSFREMNHLALEESAAKALAYENLEKNVIIIEIDAYEKDRLYNDDSSEWSLEANNEF